MNAKERDQYRNLNDARGTRGYGQHYAVLARGETQVWYMKPGYFRDGCMGFEFGREYGLLPDPENLGKTHTLLGCVMATKLEHIFEALQGMFWSPNGEARTMIERKGLRHTSMSVGDVVKIGEKVYLVDNCGFTELPKKVHRKCA